jgi:hypothetical protein
MSNNNSNKVKARQKRREILTETNKLLNEDTTLDLNINTFSEELLSTKDQVYNITDQIVGYNVFKNILNLQKKKDQTIKRISEDLGNFNNFEHKGNIQKILKSNKLVKELGNKILDSPNISTPYIKNILIPLNQFYFNTIESDIKQTVFHFLAITPEVQQKTKVKITHPVSEIEDFNKKLDEYYNTLEKGKDYSLLEFVMQDSFEESIFRLEILSYLVSSNQILLKDVSKKVSTQTERYNFSVSESEGEKLKSFETVVFGLSKENWLKMNDFYNKKTLKTRPKIPYFF